MSFLGRFRRNKIDPEAQRRALLLQSGRIGEATILGISSDAEGNQLLSFFRLGLEFIFAKEDLVRDSEGLRAELSIEFGCFVPGVNTDT